MWCVRLYELMWIVSTEIQLLNTGWNRPERQSHYQGEHWWECWCHDFLWRGFSLYRFWLPVSTDLWFRPLGSFAVKMELKMSGIVMEQFTFLLKTSFQHQDFLVEIIRCSLYGFHSSEIEKTGFLQCWRSVFSPFGVPISFCGQLTNFVCGDNIVQSWGYTRSIFFIIESHWQTRRANEIIAESHWVISIHVFTDSVAKHC